MIVYGVAFEEADKAKILFHLVEAFTLDEAVELAKKSIELDMQKEYGPEKQKDINNYLSSLRIATYKSINVTPTALEFESHSKEKIQQVIKFARDNPAWTTDKEIDVLNAIIDRITYDKKSH